MIIPCQHCGGEGRHFKSRYGGNDPNVWDAGECPICEGSGNQQCEYCGDRLATKEIKGHVGTYFVCDQCADDWDKDDEI